MNKYLPYVAAILLVGSVAIIYTFMTATPTPEPLPCLRTIEVASYDEIVPMDMSDIKHLTDADATRLGERVVMGIYGDLTFANSPADIVNRLIESEMINTYWHIGASLCVVKEEDTDEQYIIHFDGVHEYCTNRCQSESFKFGVEINKQSGEVAVFPR